MPFQNTNNDDLFHGEYEPQTSEIVAVGAIGIIVFLVILSLAIICLVYRPRARLNQLFYIFLGVSAIFELPRYCLLTHDQAYESLAGYSCHVIAGIFYFVCLAFVGFSFANILELGTFTILIYSKLGLSFAVLLHTIIDISAAVMCSHSSSLASFFASDFYRFYIVFDILQNLLYSAILVVFGVRLISRFDSLERSSSYRYQKEAFSMVVKKVTAILAIISCLTIIRLVLLAVKASSLDNRSNEKTITSVSSV